MDGRLPFRLTELRGLSALAFANPGLCASPYGTFQHWMAGLRAVDGAACGNPVEVTLPLPVVDTDAGRPPPGGRRAAHHGRDALVRVFLRSDEPGAGGGCEPLGRRAGGALRRDVPRHRSAGYLRRRERSPVVAQAVISGHYIVPGAGLVVEADPGGLVSLGPGSRTRFPASGSEGN